MRTFRTAALDRMTKQLSFFAQRQEAIWQTARTAAHGSADEREKAGIWKGIQILCHENAQCSIRCTGKNKKISTTYQINVYNLQKYTKKIVCCRIKSRKTD
jgi:hypothetical protein